MKNELRVLSIFAIICFIVSLCASIAIVANTEPVIVDVLGYQKAEINVIMSDSFYNKLCDVKYEYNGNTYQDKVEITDQTVERQYELRVNSKGKIIETQYFMLSFICFAYSCIMLIGVGFWKLEDVHKNKAIIGG